jgi:hypothetical protein
MDPNFKPYMDQRELSNPERNCHLVGKLNYLNIHSYISFALSVMSQYMVAPRQPHWEAVLRIVKYLKAYIGRRLMYKANGHLQVEEFTDLDWAESPSDRKSTTGYCAF